MKSLLFIIIGVITSLTLRSAGITENMWQYWVVLVCLVASILLSSIC